MKKQQELIEELRSEFATKVSLEVYTKLQTEISSLKDEISTVKSQMATFLTLIQNNTV